MFKKLLSAILPADPQARRTQVRRNFLHDCARMGGTLFGPVSKGGRREFFCLDQHTWVWHEEWVDSKKVHHTRTTRYDIRPHGVFKAQEGMPYQPVGLQEARRLYTAVCQYQQNLHERFDPLLAMAH